MNRFQHLLALLAALGLAFGVGCSKKSDDVTGEMTAEQREANAPPSADDMPAFVELIPAETPYVFVGLKPVPEALVGKMFKAIEPIFEPAQAELKAELARMGEPQSDEDKIAKAVLEELDGKLNRAGLKSLGISDRPRYALYGLGLMPVMRIELADPAALKAAIGRVEAKAGVKAPVQKAGETEYYGVTEDDVTVALAIIGNELVLTVVPASQNATLLPLAFGTQKPEQNIKKSGAITELMKAQGYGGFAAGYVDNRIITETLLGEGKGLNGTVFTAISTLGSGIPPLPAEHKATCSKEFKSIAAKAPRFVFGTKAVTETMWVSHFMLELDGELAGALKDISAPVPGLGSDAGDNLFVGGFGFDVGKAIGFLKGRVAAAKAAPYACPMLAGINSGLIEMEQGLNQPLPPFVNNLRGAYVVVKSADTSTMPPKNIKGYALIAADKPEQLVAMAQGMVPPLAAVKLDGETPVALPAAELGIPPMIESPHVAHTDKAIAVSFGAGEEKTLGKALGAKSPDSPPLFAFGYDVGKFMGVMQAQTRASLAGLPEEYRKQQEAELKMVEGMTQIFGMVLSRLSLTDKGIELTQNLSIK